MFSWTQFENQSLENYFQVQSLSEFRVFTDDAKSLSRRILTSNVFILREVALSVIAWSLVAEIC